MADNERNMYAQADASTDTSAKKEIVSDIIDEMGTVAEGTRIHGDITTRGHLAVAGTVIGDIDAKGNVIVTGNVKGKITCSNLMLENCNLTTEISARECVVVKEGVKINGDIACRDIHIMGAVAGDISCTGKVGLSKDAVVRGNITAAVIGVALGAKLEGNLSIK